MASPEEPRPATSTTNASNNENIIEDELDDLFNYEPGSADVFRAIDTNMDASPHIAADGAGTKRKRDNIAGGDGLGIDEEVKVRTRVPTLKLDEDLYVHSICILSVPVYSICTSCHTSTFRCKSAQG